MQSHGAVISHIKLRGNHKVTVRRMVSRATFNCNIFTGNIMCYFHMWGNLGDKRDTYCNSVIMYVWKMQMILKECWKCDVYTGCDVECIRRESFICDIYSGVPEHLSVKQEQVNRDYLASSCSHKSA